MELTEQYTYDFDWFFVDKDRFVCHVASAAGRLPAGVAELEVEELRGIGTSIRQLPERFEYEINPQLEQFKVFKNEEDRINYLSDFIEFAKRGLHSFDKTKINNFEDSHYHIVAYPKFRVHLFDPNYELSVKNGIVKFNRFRVNDVFRNRKYFFLQDIKFMKKL